MTSKTQNIINSSFTGIAAYLFADIIHEVIGHAGACLLQAHQVELLTSVYFKSSPGSIITDVAGPVSNLLFGLLIYLILNQRKSLSLFTRFLLLNIMAYNLFWFSGTILQSGFSTTGDWTFAMAEISTSSFGKIILVTAGLIAYSVSIKLTKAAVTKFTSHFPSFDLKQSIYTAYFAAAIAATITGLFYSPGRLHAALEALLEMTASLPILFIKNGNTVSGSTYQTKPNLIFNILVCILFIVFCLTLGQGIRFGL